MLNYLFVSSIQFYFFINSRCLKTIFKKNYFAFSVFHLYLSFAFSFVWIVISVYKCDSKCIYISRLIFSRLFQDSVKILQCKFFNPHVSFPAHIDLIHEVQCCFICIINYCKSLLGSSQNVASKVIIRQRPWIEIFNLSLLKDAAWPDDYF